MGFFERRRVATIEQQASDDGGTSLLDTLTSFDALPYE